MATLEQIERSLRAAHDAGDTEAASMLAAEYRRLQSEPKADFSGVSSRVLPTPKQTRMDEILTGGIEPVKAQLRDRAKQGGVMGTLADWAMPYAEMAGGGLENIASTARGIAQNLPFSDEIQRNLKTGEELSRKRAETASPYAKAGNLATSIGTWLLPGSAVSKATKGAGLPAVIAAETGLGALQGATESVVDDSEREGNVKVGALIGGTLPFLQKTGDIVENIPVLGYPVSQARNRKAAALMEEAKRVNVNNKNAVDALRDAEKLRVQRINSGIDAAKVNSKQAEAIARAEFPVQRKAKLRAIGAELGEHVKGQPITVPPSTVRKLRSLQRRFGDELPEAFNRSVDELEAISKFGKGKGEMMQQMKAAFGDAARSGKYNKTAMDEAERIMADTIMSGLPKARAEALRQTYRNYDTVYASKFKPSPKQVMPKAQQRAIPKRPYVTSGDLAPPPKITPTHRALLRSYLLTDEDRE
jgi:hypothetical protein